ncbi:MAG: FHA domain-containing protein [Bacteroidota bacterium]
MINITIGRNPSNDVVINDPNVSRQHASITLNNDGSYYICDLGSRNGTYVNGKKITEQMLFHNDIVKISDQIIPWQEYFKKNDSAYSGKIIQQFSIGRNAENNIVISDDYTSGKHAILYMTDLGEVIIQDIGSTNGTFVNDRKITSTKLNLGDKLRIARSHINWMDYCVPSQKTNPHNPKKSKKTRLLIILSANIATFILLFISTWFIGSKSGFFNATLTDSILLDSMPTFSNLNELVKYAEKAVFLIETDNSSGEAIAFGTGFFVRSDGIGLTNAHVLRDGVKWKIKTSSGQVNNIEKILKTNKTYDYAIFKVNSEESFTSLKISNTPPEKGHDIFVLGNPQGIESTLTKGIVSGLKGGTEQEVIDGRFSSGNSYIQIDVAISHGSSGSPVMNMKGEVIGIATLSFEESNCKNCNFALNIDLLRSDLENVTR